MRGSRILLATLVACELAVGHYGVGDAWVCAFSTLSLAQALTEVCFYPEQPNVKYVAATGLMLTPAAGLLLLWVCVTASFS